MDSPSPSPTNNTTIKTPDTDTETPREVHPSNSRPFSFTNGSIKPHNQQPPINPNSQHPPPLMVFSYKECLKNHAATIGGHALDGCGEFMPSPSATLADPTSLKCDACGCHRNFHRREPEEPNSKFPNSHHLYQLKTPLPQSLHRSSSTSLSPSRSSSLGPINSSPHSPPPVSHLPPPNSYFASPPQMLLALSTGFSRRSDDDTQQSLGQSTMVKTEYPNGRKRFRTKFSQEQKEKMYLFAEKVGWKMQRNEEKLAEKFCNEIGVRKGVLKIWMHNNKNTLGKRDRGSRNSDINGGDIDIGDVGRLSLDSGAQHSNGNNYSEGGIKGLNLFSNGSSSS